MTLLASTLIHLRRAAVPTSPLAASQTTLFRFPTTARCYSATPNLFSEIGLNKKKLAMEISETHDLNKSQAQKVVNTVFDSIVEVSKAFFCPTCCLCNKSASSHVSYMIFVIFYRPSAMDSWSRLPTLVLSRAMPPRRRKRSTHKPKS